MTLVLAARYNLQNKIFASMTLVLAARYNLQNKNFASMTLVLAARYNLQNKNFASMTLARDAITIWYCIARGTNVFTSLTGPTA